MRLVQVNKQGTQLWAVRSRGVRGEISASLAIHRAQSWEPTVVVTGWFDSPVATFGTHLIAATPQVPARPPLNHA